MELKPRIMAIFTELFELRENHLDRHAAHIVFNRYKSILGHELHFVFAKRFHNHRSGGKTLLKRDCNITDRAMKQAVKRIVRYFRCHFAKCDIGQFATDSRFQTKRGNVVLDPRSAPGIHSRPKVDLIHHFLRHGNFNTKRGLNIPYRKQFSDQSFHFL